MAATTNVVSDWSAADAANVATDVQNRQRWCLVFSQAKTAVFDRNMGDGSEAYTRTRAFTGVGLPGWDVHFLANDLDYPDAYFATQEGATARVIRVLITWSAEAPTAVVNALSYDYDNAIDGYVTISDPSGTFHAQDLQNEPVVFDYQRPRQTNVIASAAVDTDDVQSFRDNIVAQMAAACYRGHLISQYEGTSSYIPGATVTETPTDSLTPTSIVVDFTAVELRIKYEFTYHPASVFPDGIVRPKRVTMSVQKTYAESYYACATFEHVYKSNGMLFMSRAV